MNGDRSTMADIPGLRCIVCHADVFDEESGLIACRACGQGYPVYGGVPVMFESVETSLGEAADEATVDEVLTAFGLEADALSRLRMRAITRRRVRFGSALVEIESRQFLDRVRNTGHAVTASPSVSDAPRDLVTVPRYGWTRLYLPRRLTPGLEISANVRLENRGTVTLHEAGDGCVRVAPRWHEADGTPVDAPDLRTPLPTDLPPGQAVTVAIRLLPPSKPGRYVLSLPLVQEQVRWLPDGAASLAVDVAPHWTPEVPPGWQLLPTPPVDYDADHVAARALLADWLARHAPSPPRVLEVGGNAVPMISRLGLAADAVLVNIDVDLVGLQVGELVARRDRTVIAQLCADAFDLPFAPGSFDAIVLFATLHHFPEPALLLDRLARALRPGGFIGLFCEPVGHIWPGAVEAGYLAELLRGVNEQSFSVAEYERMFALAGLTAAEVRIDQNSLKARLVPAVGGPAA